MDLGSSLDSDERILWQGAPPSGLMLRREDIFMIPFSLMWLGFALFWEASVLGFGFIGKGHEGPPAFFALWGGMFVVIGLYMAFGRFFWDADVRGRTRYAVTNRRALIATSGMFGQVRSFGLTPSSEIASEEDGSGRGTITFGQLPPRQYPRGFPGASNNLFAFERVNNVREVLRVIRDVQNKR